MTTGGFGAGAKSTFAGVEAGAGDAKCEAVGVGATEGEHEAASQRRRLRGLPRLKLLPAPGGGEGTLG